VDLQAGLNSLARRKSFAVARVRIPNPQARSLVTILTAPSLLYYLTLYDKVDFPPLNFVKLHGEVEVLLHAFLIWGLNGSGWLL
jgi:hypothetical protein